MDKTPTDDDPRSTTAWQRHVEQGHIAPPVSQSPVSQSPVSQAPVSQAPASRPPATQPGIAEPPVPEQRIADVLYQAASGRRVRDVCDKAGISLSTFYQWRDKYGGLSAAGIQRLRQVEAENRQLRKRIDLLRFEKSMLEVELARRR